MKKRNKFLVLLLSFVFAFTMFAMAACGEDDDIPELKAKISLSETSVTLTVDGEYKDITATVKYSSKTVNWSIDDESIATIQFEGKTCRITPVSEGDAVVTAEVDGVKATCTVKVNPAEVTHTYTLALDRSELTMQLGGVTQTLAATAKVDGAVDPDAKVEWKSSNEKVATVDKGVVTAIGEGKATITATYNGKKAECSVTVQPQPVVSISLDKAKLDLIVGGEAGTVTATVQNSEENVQWSLGEGEDAFATISADGNTVTVTPVSAGTATLTAKIGEVEETVAITVTKAPVELELDIEKVELQMVDTPTATVTATVRNSNEPVVWTIGSERIATVSYEGNVCTVTAVAVGKTTLTAEVEGETQIIPVTVQSSMGSLPEEIEIELSQTEALDMTVGDEQEITATVIGSLLDPAWSVDDDTVVGLSAAEGVDVTVTALKKGDAVLTVSIGETRVTLNIHVEDPTTVELDKTEVELVNEEGDNRTATVTATVTGPVEVVTWEVTEGEEYITLSDTETNTVTITAKAAGVATIKASINDGKQTVEKTVTVTVKAPLSLTLDNATLSLIDGGADGSITATVTGTEDTVTYEVTGDTDCIEITQDGNILTVKPLKTGTATVTVSVGGKTATCEVTVTGLPVLEFTSTETFGEAGGFIWHKGLFTSDTVTAASTMELVVKVNGEVVQPNDTKLYNGEVQVQIAGTKYDDVEIEFAFKNDGALVAKATLTSNGVKEVVLDNDTLGITNGKTADVSVIKINGSESFTDKTITWTIADTEGTGVATIPENSTGATVTVTAAAVGKATLTCTVGEGEGAFSATCVITVVEGEVEEEKPVDATPNMFQQNVYSGGLYGQCVQIRYGCGAEMCGKISSVEVIATKNGETCQSAIAQKHDDGANYYVHVSVDGDWSYTYAFTIKYKNAAGKVIAEGTFTKVAQKSLKLDKNNVNLTLKAGETVTDVVTATISSTVEGEIEWSIDSTDCATIEIAEDKLSVTVTAVAKGTATITATVDGLTKTCKVTVIEDGEEPTPSAGEQLTATYSRKYGDNYVVFTLNKPLSKGADFEYYTVNGEKLAVQHYIADPAPTYQFYVGAGNYAAGTTVKIEFYSGSDIVYWFECTVG